MDLRDERCLSIIKNIYGGKIKLRSGVNSVRYRLHHKEGILKLINDINGQIRNPIRIHQLSKLCDLYNIKYRQPQPLNFDSA
jgi:hypothetical protein